MQASTAKELLEDCLAKGIIVHPALEAKNVPGAGLGIYPTAKLKAGQRIVHIPTRHIFTTANIPESFLENTARKNIAVHAQLAAYLAFGGAESQQPYQAWMATWPTLEDFVIGMPIFWSFWGDAILKSLRRNSSTVRNDIPEWSSNNNPKRRRISNNVENSKDSSSKTAGNGASADRVMKLPYCPSPALFGWTASAPSKTTMLLTMIDKLVSHITSIAEVKPDLNIINDDNKLANFLHKWCIVNTRCFYYVPPTAPGSKSKKPRAPSDPNEAMALCPFMDLFNHTVPPPTSNIPFHSKSTSVQTPCKVKYNSAGFEVVTTSPIQQNSEILLSYGAHNNDTLWSEYGFLLPDSTNTSDSILLDDIILDTLKHPDISTLEERGYLGTYTLHNDGSVCYRTEMAAWLLVLGRHKWTRVVAENLDPEENCASPYGKQMFEGLVTGWLSEVQGYSNEYIALLESFDDEKVLEHFNTVSVVAALLQNSEEKDLAIAKQRRDMCVARWKQIATMADRGTKKIKEAND